jgi:hypothetical protein
MRKARVQQRRLDYEVLHRVVTEAGGIASKIRTAADQSRGNEAQFVMLCDVLLADFAKSAGVKWEPRGERRVVRREEGIRAGRYIDRLFNSVVVEFEPPGMPPVSPRRRSLICGAHPMPNR